MENTRPVAPTRTSGREYSKVPRDDATSEDESFLGRDEIFDHSYSAKRLTLLRVVVALLALLICLNAAALVVLYKGPKAEEVVDYYSKTYSDAYLMIIAKLCQRQPPKGNYLRRSQESITTTMTISWTTMSLLRRDSGRASSQARLCAHSHMVLQH